jgi:hypothetical protein
VRAACDAVWSERRAHLFRKGARVVAANAHRLQPPIFHIVHTLWQIGKAHIELQRAHFNIYIARVCTRLNARVLYRVDKKMCLEVDDLKPCKNEFVIERRRRARISATGHGTVPVGCINKRTGEHAVGVA